MRSIYFILLITLAACQAPESPRHLSIDLQGKWQFALDTGNVGVDQKWFQTDFQDSVSLPGTTDSNQRGFQNDDTTTMHLNRLYRYEGVAWYRRKVLVPDDFEGKHLQLFLERSKPSQVWVDDQLVGNSMLLQSPQIFDVTDYLTPGEHFITLRIDNDLKLTPYGNVHIYSDDTQTNWNGVLGKMNLEASEKTFIADLQVYPDISGKKFSVSMQVANGLELKEIDVMLRVEKNVNGVHITLPEKKVRLACQSRLELEYTFEKELDLWDEYHQPLYSVTAIISDGKISDAQSASFGMRAFSVTGTQFSINGRTTFLRGKHEAAVFPLTGHPPMDVEGWTRVFKIAKSYGINHYRFHTYCPPEAAFTAADQEGIYLQAELPFWGGLESDTVAENLRKEGLGMLNAYANHPSFVMFSPGNEIWGGHDKVENIMQSLKVYDDRPLYAMGSNNNIGYMEPKDYAEFFVGARVPDHGDSTLGHARLTHAYADAWNGGILNTQEPSTEINFDYAVSHMKIPLVSHEIGQYQIYPDYKEIEKYTGVLRAWNLELFKQRLEKAGMSDKDSIFQKATGAWAALCYKAEMEAALRTKGMAGFQLLDLQDFPGQGTALVGILDAFMDSKGVISPEVWRQSCNDVVVLLEFPNYCWTNAETFHARVAVANYSNKKLENDVTWEIRKQDGTAVEQGSFLKPQIDAGALSAIGEISTTLSSLAGAQKLTIQVSIAGTGYSNEYPIWVYPEGLKPEKPGGLLVAERLTNSMIAQLENGTDVLLFPQTSDVEKNSVKGHFPPEFWNYGMFKGISEWAKKPVSPGTLGLLMDPDHPLFQDFPTDFHTNWQWYSIVKSSNSLILDELPADYDPIVQVVDNLERNYKLGLVFEFKVGKGRLLVCMASLPQLTDRPEAIQLYQSMLNYMGSDRFDPQYAASVDQLKKLGLY